MVILVIVTLKTLMAVVTMVIMSWRNIRDVVLPQTDSDESSPKLKTGVVGAVGTGAP